MEDKTYKLEVLLKENESERLRLEERLRSEEKEKIEREI